MTTAKSWQIALQNADNALYRGKSTKNHGINFFPADPM
jgi:hypothetical protein